MTVLITGGSGLVGRGLAAYFSGRGCRVVLAARNLAELQQAAAEVDAAGCYTMDLAETASLTKLAAALDADGLVPDVLINNAADVTSKPFLETSLDEIDHIIRVNVTGTLQLSRLLFPQLKARGHGAIVNISSLAGYKPNPAQTVYSISKTAINGISEGLRAELGPRGIHVVNVALMGVGEGPGRIPVDDVARRIERAILRKEPEIYFYHSTKWLMRLYAAFPALARLR